MKKIVTPKQMSACDAYMIERLDISGVVLMEHAALSVANTIINTLTTPKGSVLVVCGKGNNGGDGFAVMRLLHMRGMSVDGVLLASPNDLTGDAKKNYLSAVACGISIKQVRSDSDFTDIDIASYQLIVDAIFGTGLSKEVLGLFRFVIDALNRSNVPIIAVDIPSGIDGATGCVCGTAIRAKETVTFQYAKIGHMLYPGREYTGHLQIFPIGPYLSILEKDYSVEQLEKEDIVALLPPRHANSNKGTYGKGLLISGSETYVGAALMSAKSALRAGCGILRVAVPQSVKPAFAALPEAICISINDSSEWDMTAADHIEPCLGESSAIAIGPGMGAGEGIASVLYQALKTQKPLVIDADGLNALSRHSELLSLLHENVILTPHPGEMSRLLQTDISHIIHDPITIASQAASRWNCHVVLKGATTVIASPHGRITINTTGNPGLAKGGSGDVLTGILLALLCQGLCAYDAARAGCYLLGASADEAWQLLQNRMMMSRDIIEAIDRILL